MATSTLVASPVATTWQIDPSHTLLEFAAKHMMITTVKGRFTGVQGTIQWDQADIARSSAEVTVDVNSLTTGDEKRDAHLRSADFFDVENHPTITFKSTRVEVVDAENVKLHGDLTIHGVTRPVVLATELVGQQKSPWGTEVAGFAATTSVNRKDFGLNWNVAMETGGWLVGDSIKLALEVQAIKRA